MCAGGQVFSLAMGDREDRWLSRPFQMTPDGPWWIPPEEPLTSSDDSEDEFEREKQREKEREIRRKKELLGDRCVPGGEECPTSCSVVLWWCRSCISPSKIHLHGRFGQIVVVSSLSEQILVLR